MSANQLKSPNLSSLKQIYFNFKVFKFKIGCVRCLLEFFGLWNFLLTGRLWKVQGPLIQVLEFQIGFETPERKAQVAEDCFLVSLPFEGLCMSFSIRSRRNKCMIIDFLFQKCYFYSRHCGRSMTDPLDFNPNQDYNPFKFF